MRIVSGLCGHSVVNVQITAVYGHVTHSKIKQIIRSIYLAVRDWMTRIRHGKKPVNLNSLGSEFHTLSCTVCRLFGNTVIASRARIADAYPVNPAEIRREERNGVAIDRVYGSVAHGPFNFEVLTAGEFTTTITVKNFTTAQLALIALAIRDFDEQRVSIGFAKSRGLGQVNMKVNSVEICYPTAVIENQQLRMIGNQTDSFSNNIVVGAGQLVDDADNYGFPNPDSVPVNVQAQQDDYGLGATLNLESSDEITALWQGCVRSWSGMLKEE